MKILPASRVRRALAIAVAVPVLAVATLSLPWRGDRARTPPRVEARAWAAGPLAAGAASVPFALPDGVPIGGYPRLRWASEGAADEVGVRALVVESAGVRVALASAEILVVPAELDDAVRDRVSDLELSGLVLAATHTHAGPGGYWDSALGAAIGTGPFDPAVRDAIADAVADAIRSAVADLGPARLSVGRGRVEALARNRHADGETGGELTVARFDRPDEGKFVAELVVFPAHATILGKENRRVSGDWPGRFAADGRHGVRVFFQGALGDQSVAFGGRAPTPETYARELSDEVERLRFLDAGTDVPVGYATAEVALPAPSPAAAPRLLRPAARTLLDDALPSAAAVRAVRIGPLVLAAVPGEPVAAVGAEWASASGGATVVALAGGYIGYVETPARVDAGAGEAVRTYYGPELAARLGDGVRAVTDALASRPAVPATPPAVVPTSRR